MSDPAIFTSVGHSIDHDAADRFAGMHQVEALVDVVERELMGDQLVDLDLAVHVPVDDARDVAAAARAAKGGAFPDPTGDQLKRPRADLLPRGGDADDDADAPAAMRAFERLAHRRDIADAFEAVIGPALGQIDEIGHEVALDLARVDEMGHAEGFGQGTAARVDVDPDDHIGADHAAALHDIEPDAAEPEHDDPGAGLDLGGVDDGADPGRHAAADVADLVEWRVLADFRYRDFGQNGEIRERRGAHVVVDRLAPEREPAGAVGHHAPSLRRADRGAQIGLVREARFAVPA